MFLLFLIIGSNLLDAQDLTILHLNDTHSHIEPERHGAKVGLGGVFEQAAYIDSVRCADGKENVLLLHAGDFSQGSSYFKQLKGDVEVAVINAMKFDAVCIGNHEFDNGTDELARRLKNINVPVVCANYDFTRTALGNCIRPYVIVEKAGRKIGIIGLLTDISTLVETDIAAKIKYLPPAQIAEKYASRLKSEGCDLVICLTHLGFDDVECSDKDVAAHTRSVDIIVGGHTHTELEDYVAVPNLDGKDVVIVQNGKWGIDFGHLSVKF